MTFVGLTEHKSAVFINRLNSDLEIGVYGRLTDDIRMTFL